MAGDGSVVIAGETRGNWDGTNAGDSWPVDFAAFRLDKNGTEVWRYQVGFVTVSVAPRYCVTRTGTNFFRTRFIQPPLFDFVTMP